MSRIRHLFVFVALRYANLFVERRDIKTKEVVKQLLAIEFGSAPTASGGKDERSEVNPIPHSPHPTRQSFTPFIT